jgi:hypothetical protein
MWPSSSARALAEALLGDSEEDAAMARAWRASGARAGLTDQPAAYRGDSI